MALFYKNQGEVETLAVKSTLTSRYRSDHRVTVYGGRGGSYDKLQYLRRQNTDATAVNAKLSDAITKFGPANGAPGTRADQIQRDFNENGLYP